MVTQSLKIFLLKSILNIDVPSALIIYRISLIVWCLKENLGILTECLYVQAWQIIGISEIFDDIVATVSQSNEITYFRMFLAFKNLENKILNSPNTKELHKRLFVYPGCLLELKEKVVDMQFDSQIFQWFVLQEINKFKKCGE